MLYLGLFLMKRFSYKLTPTGIYGHLLYRVHKDEAKALDGADLLLHLRRAVKKANELLHHQECNIVVVVEPESTMPEEGIGGFTWSQDWVRITLDMHHRKGIGKIISEHLGPTVVHELHHASRNRQAGIVNTLGKALVMEGLACVFEEELYPQHKAAYAYVLTPAEIAKTWKAARPLLDSSSYSDEEWFWDGSKKIKRWAGYSLGYDIVQKFMDSHPKSNPATLVDVAAKEFLKGYSPDS